MAPSPPLSPHSEPLPSASASAASLGHRVVFVDTNGVFSAKRVKAFHRSFWSEEANEEEVGKHLAKTLELIAVHDVHDVFTLLHLLDQLMQDASEEDNNPEKSNTTGLLVIDSLSLLLAPLLTRAHHQGQTVMTMVAVMLRAIASERKVAVLYTNHTVADTQANVAPGRNVGGYNSLDTKNARGTHSRSFVLKPALGVRWISVPHRRLKLSKFDEESENSKIKAELVNGGSSESCSIHFEIRQTALVTI